MTFCSDNIHPIGQVRGATEAAAPASLAGFESRTNVHGFSWDIRLLLTEEDRRSMLPG
jgi:hypothetical protein